MMLEILTYNEIYPRRQGTWLRDDPVGILISSKLKKIKSLSF